MILENIDFFSFIKQAPSAFAVLKGGNGVPSVNGTVAFYNTNEGTLVATRVYGLPTGTQSCDDPIFAMHIHNGNACTGTSADNFADALTHLNPNNCLHPYHAGDMPPLFGVNGNAFSVFLTGRFSVENIIGKTVIIHSGPDDFTSQPSGNSGTKIACGVIEKFD